MGRSTASNLRAPLPELYLNNIKTHGKKTTTNTKKYKKKKARHEQTKRNYKIEPPVKHIHKWRNYV